MSVDDIVWDVEPTPPGVNRRSGRLTCEAISIAAQMRPGVWGRYDYPTTTQATGYAFRLRGMGLDATSRGTSVYFRKPS